MPNYLTIYPDCPIHFLAKRAYRFGAVRKADLLDAFDLSVATATRIFKAGAAYYAGHLRRAGHVLVQVPNTLPPAEAGEAALIEYLDARRLEFRQLGLRPAEISVSYPRWTAPLPAKPWALTRILNAHVRKQGVEILYSGLRRGENASWRKVFPAGFEQMGDQWRVIGRLLDNPEFPWRVFVLPRVLDVSASYIPLPRACPRLPPPDNLVQYRVTLNPGLTPDQAAGISNELQLQHGKVLIPGRWVYEFRQRFASTAPNESIAWPLVQDMAAC